MQNAFNNVKSSADALLQVIKDIVGWIRDIPTPHIDWPDPPKWLPGVRMAPAPAVAGYAAPRVAGLGGAAARAGGGAGPVTINVYGAVDPEAVARQIGRIMSGHDRRVGRRVVRR